MSDDWDFFFCQVDHNPASILVDLGISDQAPLDDYSDLAWLRLRMQNPRDDGLSSREEYPRLTEIEDAITDAVADQEAGMMYVGRSTCRGNRDFFFYAANGQKAELCLSAAMVPFRDYDFEVGSRSDQQWTTYRDFLYPSSREFQTIMNGRVLAGLEDSGDKHEIERQVCHWAYFKSADDRDRFLEAARKLGYDEVRSADDAESQRPFCASVARVHAVDYVTINQVVLELFDLAEAHQGEYSGWETSVEDGSPDEPS